jgi:taurine dioxygenase
MLDALELKPGPRKFLDARRRELAELRFERIAARPLATTLGAEISGVDLSDLDDATFAEIERAFLEFKVIFFRDQDLPIDAHLEFARRFGELEEHPFLPAKGGYGQVIQFAKDADAVGVENIWHSDVSWREIPSLGSVLHALEVPIIGGDTLWADMEAAYQGLDPETRERIADLRAVHDFTHSFGLLLSPEELEKKRAEFPAVEHPVVRTHPVTGRKSIYVNAIFTSHIVGLPEAESDALLVHLCRQAQVPEYQCRFRWEKHSVALWDNRAVQHYAANDYWPQRRVMERVTIIGDRPH